MELARRHVRLLTAYPSSIFGSGLFSDQFRVPDGGLLARARRSLVLHPVLQLVEISAHMRGAEFWHRNGDSGVLGPNENDRGEVCFAHDEFPNGINAVIYSLSDSLSLTQERSD
jgi:hypothetical protein